MRRRAELKVSLVGHSVYDAPMDDETGEPILPGVQGKNTVDGHSSVNGFIQVIPEFAGRACYQSFDRPSEKTATNQGYLANILRQKHFSVLEHSSVSFYITGVSRALTHELVRHRHFSPSQLSQRYVPIEDLRIVVHPLIEDGIRKMIWASQSTPIEQATHIQRAAVERDAVAKALDQYAESAAEEACIAYQRALDFVSTMFPDAKPKQLREAARMKLPNEVETRIVITGNFRTWIEFLIKRDSPAADAEIQRLAHHVGVHLGFIAPNIFGPTAREYWDPWHAQEPPR